MFNKKIKSVLAVAVLATFVAAPLVTTAKVEAGAFRDRIESIKRHKENQNHDGMAWREQQDNDDPNGTKAFNRTHGRANEDGSDGMAWRERQDNNNGSKNSDDDPNGMNAFNRTHGRANDDGHDGMAWREQQDDPNGTNAFNRTHGR